MEVDYVSEWESRRRRKMAQVKGPTIIPIKSKGELNDNVACSDELDHLPLVQRRKLLVLRNRKTTWRCNGDVVVKKEDEDSQVVIASSSHVNVREGSNGSVGHCFPHANGGKELGVLGDFKCKGADMEALKLKSQIASEFADNLDHIVLRERQKMLLARKMMRLEKPILEGMPMDSNSWKRLDHVPASVSSMACPSLLNTIRVKAEPLDHELANSDRNAVDDLSLSKVRVKCEQEISFEHCDDKLDHIRLQDRIKMQRKGETSDISENFECSGEGISSAGTYSPSIEAPEPISFIRPRKRKKTATDSVETAMEEDAPGLLQVLLEQGVSIGEIKLYGETESDEAIDESFIEDGFGELEAVMSKLIFQRNSLLKLAPIKSSKVSKPSYCLACLFSLVEQTRYLRFRNWPAEWGWCRDLQSFIFVFEKHNRIVLERPEYGYATYFFELVDSLSTDWQIKRMVTAMKLTNCGRISIIEDRPLLVGEDITKGEAEVLMQFGWTANSGLGTMLNYCDRVFHDRKNEKDSSEWRLKIGKLLMDGYNGGSIISNNAHTEDIQCTGAESSQIKMEL